MPLTPADIHNMAFKKPPIGKRGYDEEEVDAFLDEVEQQLIRLIEENEALRSQMHQSDAGAGVTSAELSALAAQLDRFQQARARAEQAARELQMQLEQARAGAGEHSERVAAVLAMAQRTADDHLHDARQEAAALLVAARDQSQRITAEAQTAARTTEGDARRHHTEAMTRLESDRAALLAEIERLGELARSYHAALAGHITQQLQELDGTSGGPDRVPG